MVHHRVRHQLDGRGTRLGPELIRAQLFRLPRDRLERLRREGAESLLWGPAGAAQGISTGSVGPSRRPLLAGLSSL